MKAGLTVLAIVAVVAAAGGGFLYGRTQTPAPEAAERAGAPSDSTQADLEPMRQEITRLLDRLAAAEGQADSLRAQLAVHQEESEARTQSASGLASTLSKLEDDALSDVIQKLDGRSFVQLYEAASARNQARLLAALTPDQAASFVRYQLPGGPARARAATVSDTTQAG